jgi:4Fe-4S dicluster domain
VITRSDFDGHSHKCTLCYDRQADGLVPACAKACSTASIHFGPIDELRDRARQCVDESAMVVGLPPAFGSLDYKGVLFSTGSQPGWKDARWLGGYMANSALVLGCAELLFVSVLTGRARRRRSPQS